MLANFINLRQASSVAGQVDSLFDFLTLFSALSFFVVIAALVYFTFKYHRKKSDPETTPYIEGHPLLEGTVVVGLFILVMGVFYWGWLGYKAMRNVPANALEINVLGRQWTWDFEYTNGRHSENLKINVNGRDLAVPQLVIPKDRPIKLLMTSQDVLHSFFIPEFRVKQDLVPGSYSYLSFTATEVGEYQVYCAEYCGLDHSMMYAKVKVVESAEYDQWQKKWEWEKQLGISDSDAGSVGKTVASGEAPVVSSKTPVEKGKDLFDVRCAVCHSVDGTLKIGPSLKAVFGHEVELQDGKKVMADENYIRESLMDPTLKVVKGFQPMMPTFKGQLSDEEVNSIVAYIKSLAN